MGLPKPNDPTNLTQSQFAPPGTAASTPSNNGANPNNENKVIDYMTGAVQATGNTTSLFNAFYVFKYSGGVSSVSRSLYTSLSTKTTPSGDNPAIVSNPTASAIVDWSNGLAKNPSPYGLNNSTYSWSDFLFCKHYGIIPNNRLLTLRKYPLGTQDDASVKRNVKVTNLPVAQAVAWFGPGTPNSINDLWQNKWELAWKQGSTDAKNVQGNEIVNFSQALKNVLPTNTNPLIVKAIENLATMADLTAAATGNGAVRQNVISAGKAEIEKKIQEFQKNLYSDTGAFFNQILGPVNVKNSFLYRDRGLSNAAVNSQWTIQFDYKTNSYFGMNQRRVALDLIANMLELTYSSGEWLESLNVYYKNLGIALRPDEQAHIEACLVGGNFDALALSEVFYNIAASRVDKMLTSGIALVSQGADAALSGLTSFITGDNASILASIQNPNDPKYAQLRDAIQIELTKALAGTFPGFVQQRANVGNIPTGNWHLTIGNPMNPIMRIGDLVVKSCELTFGEELGADDFPIDMAFKVVLGPTKPRDGRDIRKTFNAGRADYVETFMGHTADQGNTYGVVNKLLTAESAGTNAKALADGVADAAADHASVWLNSRYGEGTVNAKFLESVYFYKPGVTEFDWTQKMKKK
jgi:hypothetical protein